MCSNTAAPASCADITPIARRPQAIYNEQRPIDEIIARMQAYKSSSNPREQVRK